MDKLAIGYLDTKWDREMIKSSSAIHTAIVRDKHPSINCKITHAFSDEKNQKKTAIHVYYEIHFYFIFLCGADLWFARHTKKKKKKNTTPPQ